jgi:hypothetical protein
LVEIYESSPERTAAVNPPGGSGAGGFYRLIISDGAPGKKFVI